MPPPPIVNMPPPRAGSTAVAVAGDGGGGGSSPSRGPPPMIRPPPRQGSPAPISAPPPQPVTTPTASDANPYNNPSPQFQYGNQMPPPPTSAPHSHQHFHSQQQQPAVGGRPIAVPPPRNGTPLRASTPEQGGGGVAPIRVPPPPMAGHQQQQQQQSGEGSRMSPMRRPPPQIRPPTQGGQQPFAPPQQQQYQDPVVAVPPPLGPPTPSSSSAAAPSTSVASSRPQPPLRVPTTSRGSGGTPREGGNSGSVAPPIVAPPTNRPQSPARSQQQQQREGGGGAMPPNIPGRVSTPPRSGPPASPPKRPPAARPTTAGEGNAAQPPTGADINGGASAAASSVPTSSVGGGLSPARRPPPTRPTAAVGGPSAEGGATPTNNAPIGASPTRRPPPKISPKRPANAPPSLPPLQQQPGVETSAPNSALAPAFQQQYQQPVTVPPPPPPPAVVSPPQPPLAVAPMPQQQPQQRYNEADVSCATTQGGATPTLAPPPPLNYQQQQQLETATPVGLVFMPPTPKRGPSPMRGNRGNIVSNPNATPPQIPTARADGTPVRRGNHNNNTSGAAGGSQQSTPLEQQLHRFSSMHPRPETLSSIAERTGTAVSLLQSLNPHLRHYDPVNDVLPVGTTVHVPATNEAVINIPTVRDVDGEREREVMRRTSVSSQPSIRRDGSSTSPIPVVHTRGPPQQQMPSSLHRSQMGQTGEQGETLLDVASNTETPVKVLLKYNPHLIGYPLDKPLQPGTQLSLPDGDEDDTEDNASGRGASASQQRPDNKKDDGSADDDEEERIAARADEQLKEKQRSQSLLAEINGRNSISGGRGESNVVPTPPSSPARRTSSVHPSSSYKDTEVDTLHRIGKHYNVTIGDLIASNVDLYEQYQAMGQLPLGTRVNVPLIVNGDVAVKVFTVGVGLEGEEDLFGLGSSGEVPTTLEEIAMAKRAPTIELVRSWATLQSHLEVGRTFPQREITSDYNGDVSYVDENVWTVSEFASLPESVAAQLMSYDPSLNMNRTPRSLEGVVAVVGANLDVQSLRKANPALPPNYPSNKPLPYGYAVLLPAAPSAPSVLSPPPPPSPPKRHQDNDDDDEARLYQEGDETQTTTPSVKKSSSRSGSAVNNNNDGTKNNTNNAANTTSNGRSVSSTAYQYADGLERVRSLAGETLADVARRCGRDPHAVFALNPTIVDDEDELFEEELAEGTIVCLPPASQATPTPFGGGANGNITNNTTTVNTSDKKASSPDEPPVPRQPSVVAPTPIIAAPPASTTAAVGRNKNEKDDGHDSDYDKFLPDMNSATLNGARGGDNEGTHYDPHQPTKTILANGRDTLRDVCNEYFLTEDQLRSMNPFMLRYYTYTVIPKNTCVVLETIGMAHEQRRAREETERQAQQQLIQQRQNANIGEMFNGRRVFIVRSPVRGRPANGNNSPPRGRMSPSRLSTPDREHNNNYSRNDSNNGHSYPRGDHAINADNTQLPVNTIEAIAKQTGIPEKLLRRRNPSFAALASTDVLPRDTIVELDGDVMGPIGAGIGGSNMTFNNNTNTNAIISYDRNNSRATQGGDEAEYYYDANGQRISNNNSNGIALLSTGGNRGLNKRQVVRVMGHKAAVIIGQRYFNKWRLFTSMFNSQRLQNELAIENEREQMRVALQAGQIKEADLRRRVAELRIALDANRPSSSSSSAAAARVHNGYDQTNMSIYSAIATNQQRANSPFGIAGMLTYSESRPNDAMTTNNNALLQQQRQQSPTRANNWAGVTTVGQIAGGSGGGGYSAVRPVQQLAAAPPLNESRFPADQSREVGGTDIGGQYNARRLTPLRDQPTLNENRIGGIGAVGNAYQQHQNQNRLSPIRRLLDATSSPSMMGLQTADGRGYHGFDLQNSSIAATQLGSPTTTAAAAAGKRSLGLLLNGLRVTRAIGAAAAAGIQPGDTVIRVGGQLVSSGTGFKAIVDRERGPKVSLTVQTPTGHIFTTMLPLCGGSFAASSPTRTGSPMRFNNGFPISTQSPTAAGTAVHMNSSIHTSLVPGPQLGSNSSNQQQYGGFASSSPAPNAVRTSPLRRTGSPMQVSLNNDVPQRGGLLGSPYRRRANSPKGAYKPLY